MIWLAISILCFMWIVVWIIIHIELFRQAIIYKHNVKGAPLWTVIIPLIITAITLMLFFNSIE